MMEAAARGRSSVGRVENEARKPEYQTSSISDCRELLVSSISGKEDVRTMVQALPCARAAVGSSHPLAVQKNQTLRGL